MSHDKKKSKKTSDDARVPVEAICDTSKGSSNPSQKGSGDAKTSLKNAAPDTKMDSKKGSKAKK